ncbi:class F sortase [Streptomyces sp. PKU-MA01144]|uniref:class F sortase n=1 Tax=Streptomyces TaxID=1883 RepID=UPI00147BBCF0|nr:MULTISPECIES: class F sortase [Streptomyces]MCY0981529.1 class F sortase [Streptomyces tirandamycinicus]NNJ02703.1 class F sortase [Streptomyces sp. PKU-MA01144]
MGRRYSSLFTSSRIFGVMLLVGIGLLVHGLRGETAPQPSAAQAFTAPSPGATLSHRPAVPALLAAPSPGRTAKAAPGTRSRSVPVRLRIPAIGVDTPLMNLALGKNGVLEVPPVDKAQLAGWYSRGPAPGEVGAAVVAGHVDTPTGRAVFYRLGALTKGSAIQVTRLDGRTAHFSVDAVEVYAKHSFPSHKVYAGTTVPQLRVITCGGGYTKRTGYLGNLVVYATLKRIA